MKKFIVLVLVLLSFSTVFAGWKSFWKGVKKANSAFYEGYSCGQKGFKGPYGSVSSPDECSQLCYDKGFSEYCTKAENSISCFCK